MNKNKYIQSIYLIIILTLSFYNISKSNEEIDESVKKKVINAMINNRNSIGRYFVIALPPNDHPSTPVQVAEIYVAASEKSKITLISPSGQRVTKNCDPFKTITFSSLVESDLFTYSEEIRISEVILPKAWAIESDNPISVYVINSKAFSTDGYLAIPAVNWGKEYYHCSFWDFKEQSYADWAGGFIVIAAEDSTKVDIKLNGRGKGFAKTNQGREIGESIRVTLMKGETYMVMGDGKTRGAFDLTGSKITADKNIGVISFHNRTMIPSFVVNSGRDHLCEFMTPVKSWGKNYVTVELKRETNMGDYFRVVASQDNTNGTLKWYDKNTKKIISEQDITLRKAGDFLEFYNTSAQAPHNFPSVRGTSVWEFDKPTLVVQYSYSANWDNADGNYDPMMFLITPTEQFTRSTIFQTPQNSNKDNEYNYNLFNLVATGDTLDPLNNQKLLESITLDGKRIVELESKLINNNIPGTNQYWAQVLVTPGPHFITGETPFGAYIYGFSSFDSYAWPAATAYKTIGELDSFPPIPIIINKVNKFEIRTTELRNGPTTDEVKQVETGIGQEPKFLNGMYNLGPLKYELGSKWTPYPANIDFKTFVAVLDSNSDAYGQLYFIDEAGNDTIIEISYKAPAKIEDSNKPVTQWSQDCSGDILNGTVKDLPDNPSIRSNLNEIKMLTNDSLSYNYNFQFTPIQTGKSVSTAWNLKIIDKTKDAKATLYFADTKGNDTVFEINYSVVNYSLEGKQDFGEFKLEESATFDFNLENLSKTKSVVYNIPQLKYKNQGFKIEPLNWDIKTPVEPLGKRILKVTFTLDTNLLKNKTQFEDTLSISDDCNFVTKNIKLNANKTPETSIKVKEIAFSLSGIYPNPVNGNGGNINYSVGFAAKITIKLFDIEGNLVETLVDNDKMPAGNYSISIPIDRLNSGIYFYQMESGPFKSTEKLVIQK